MIAASTAILRGVLLLTLASATVPPGVAAPAAPPPAALEARDIEPAE
ncbi:MAG: hypothetical protein K6T74_10405 [Geminicoccaceae bacterium]|nr:hypothetical protein [Geminicoccaceae bacterium]